MPPASLSRCSGRTASSPVWPCVSSWSAAAWKRSRSGLKALVVDAAFGTCDSVTKMLVQVGMRSEWTLSGKEAVLRAGQSMELNDPFRAYIIDWRLPDMNGIEVARQIRSLGDDTPIIILSAYDWTDIEAEARAAGVTAFCAKPIRIEEVLLTLQGVFHQGSIRYREKTLLPFRTLRGEVGAFASYGVFV